MAKNTRGLQKESARLLVAGYSIPEIAKKLEVRQTTVERWQTMTSFQKHLEECMQFKRAQLEYRKLDMAHTVMMHLEAQTSQIGMIDTNEACRIYNILKNIDKASTQEAETCINLPKSARRRRKSAETMPKSAETAPQSAPI